MAHSISSKKRMRQNAKRRASNRARRSALKSKMRKTLKSVADGGASAASDARELVKHMDREANRGLLHPNAAARHKSRLAKRLNAAKAKATG
ncbi:MAG: 30S ribosomal protein S20 [Phycisphaerae bacterium]